MRNYEDMRLFGFLHQKYPSLSFFLDLRGLNCTLVLRLFRTSQIVAVIPLAMYALLLHLGGLLGYVREEGDGPVGGILYDALFGNWAPTPFYATLSALVLVLVQGFFANVLIDRYRLLGERNWFPGLFYVLVASSLPSLTFLSASLVAATFILFSIWAVFRAYQKPKAVAVIFDAGFWIGLASLFYPPAILLLLGAFMSMIIVRSFSVREQAVFWSGAFVPVFLAWFFYFWFDRGGEFRSVQFRLDILPIFEGKWDIVQGSQAAWWALVLFIAFVFFRRLSSRKHIRAQKSVKVLYYYLVAALFSCFWAEKWHWSQLLLCVPALGSIMAMLFTSIKREFWAEWWHLILLAAALYFQYHALFIF